MRKINTDLPEYIYQSSITALIDKIDESKIDSELPWNTFGGSVYAGQRFIDYLNTNRDFKINANVTGIVASMGPVTLPFFDHVKGANQSDLMIHSVAGGSNQEHTNKFLYDALAKKVDEVKFKEVTGLELEKVMMAKEDERINVWITGKQAGYIGFYDETYDLLDKAASLESKIDVKELGYKLPDTIQEKYGLKKAKIVKSNNSEMEIKDLKKAELQTGNPSVYNAILEEGKQAVTGSLSDERARVASIMKYAEFDMPKATEMIEKGATLEIADVEHFLEKKHAKTEIETLENDSEDPLNPGKKAVVVVTKKETPEEKKEKEAWANELEDIRVVTGAVETEKK